MTSQAQNKSFLAGTVIYLISNVINAAIPFALLPVLTRYLSPEQYGEVAMFQTLLGALAAFVGLSMHGAAGRKFYDSNLGNNELKEFVGSCLQILLITTAIVLFVLLLISSQLTEWLGLESRWVFLALITTACTVVFQIRLSQWQVRKQASKYGVAQIVKSVFNVAISLGLVVVLMQGSVGRMSAQVWTATIFAIVAIGLLKRDDLLCFFVWRPAYIREILRFGVPLIPHVGGMFLLVSVDRFVINSELGLAKAGIYMIAVQFSAALSLIFDAVNKAFVPWLFERLKRDDATEKASIVKITYAWYAFILSCAALAFLIGAEIVTLIAGQPYAQAGEIIGWLVLGQVFGGMYLMVTNYIFYSKRTGLLSLVTIFSGILNVVLLIVLIGQFGLKGAAYAFCIAMGIRFLLTWVVAHIRHPMPWFNFYIKS